MADATYAPSDATSSHVSASVGSASAGSPPSNPPPSPAPVVVKKYANRRWYNTETSSYITLDNLADMIRAGRDFVVYDAKSGEDITRGVLTQIIVEEESKGTSMLPTAFLRQLIGFYGDSLQGVVPRYLETAMSSFAKQQQQLRQAVQQSISPFLPAGVEEMSRQNLAMIERAMSLFNPFHRGAEPPPAAPGGHAEPAAEPSMDAELDRLRQEVGELRSQLAAAHAAACAGAHEAPPQADEAAAPVQAEQVAPAPTIEDAPKAEPPHAEAADAAQVSPAGPIGAAAALAVEPHSASTAVDAAIHHAVEAIAGRAAAAAAPNMPADPKLAAALGAGRRNRTARSKS